MPQMGVSVSEGTVTRWLKQPGDTVELDETLLEISTDKVDTEVPSPGAGVVAEIRVQEGETVEVGTVLAVIAPEGSSRPSRRPRPSPRRGRRGVPRERQVPAAPAPSAGSGAAHRAPRRPPSLRPDARARRRAGTATGARSSRRSSRASPPSTASTRAAVPGTGQGGRVTKKDILAYIESGRPAAAPAEETPAAAAAAPASPRPRPRRSPRRPPRLLRRPGTRRPQRHPPRSGTAPPTPRAAIPVARRAARSR